MRLTERRYERCEVVEDTVKVWVLTATSESGGTYGPWVFHTHPARPALKKFLKEQCPAEFAKKGGYGDWGSHLYVALDVAELVRAPKA